MHLHANQNKIHTYIHWEDAIANCTAEHITPLLYLLNEPELALCYSFCKTIVCFVGKMKRVNIDLFFMIGVHVGRYPEYH